MSDHIHILIGMRATQSLSDLMQGVKGASSKWINQNKLTRQKFQWREGFGAFSYPKSNIIKVIDCIRNQEEHHHQQSYIEEHRHLLDEEEIAFDEKYIFTTV